MKRAPRMPKAGPGAPELRRLHPIDALGIAPAREGEVRVERLERRLQPRVPFPHKHDFYHFLYLEAGSGWHEIDFTRYPARRGQLFFVKPGQVHAWQLGRGTRGFVLEFTASSLEASQRNRRLLRGLEAAPGVVEGSEVLPLLRLMHEEFTEAKPGFRAALESLLAALIVRVSRAGGGEGEGKAPAALVEKFRGLVERNFRREHKVEAYAAELGTTTKALTTQVARALGRPAGALIQERCLVEAKRLLAHSDLSVSEVGYELGFDDPNYFARFFRSRTGLTPGRFRRLAARSVPH